MEQKIFLERMVKIVPKSNRLYELLKYDKFWHRYDGKILEKYEKTLCGEVFKSFSEEEQENHYKCGNIEEFFELQICPHCLKNWYEKTEKEFNSDQLLGTFHLSLWEENAAFLQMFIENEGYDKLNETVNELLFEHLQENNLLEKLEKKQTLKQ
jgi:hypothetical protein